LNWAIAGFLWDTHAMLIGDRICAIREAKKLSLGDIEKRCSLLRVYISQVENGHLVPSAETLEKLARALEVPLYNVGTTNLQVETLLVGRRGFLCSVSVAP